jgi:hypothetical protein
MSTTPPSSNKFIIIGIIVASAICLISCISSIIGGVVYYNSQEEEDSSPTSSSTSSTPSDGSNPNAPTPNSPTPNSPTPNSPTPNSPAPGPSPGPSPDLQRIPGEITFIANADVTCPDGYTGTWLSNDNLTGGNWYGATTCQDSPSAKTFLIANGGDCPTGSNKIGWIPNTSISDTNWHGATMCEYSNERPIVENHTYVLGNNSDCPVGNKVGWIKNTAFQKRSTTATGGEYYGLTICDRR